MEPAADSQHAHSPVPAEPSELATTRPTHHLAKIKVGNHGVQLLVSTKEHVYEASEVEAGEESWQVIGAWSEDSVPELRQILSQRSTTIQSKGQSLGPARFGGGYGTGKKLGVTPQENPDAMDNRL